MADTFLSSRPFATPRFRKGFTDQVHDDNDPFGLKEDSFFNFTGQSNNTNQQQQPQPQQQVNTVAQQQSPQQNQQFNLQNSELFKLTQRAIADQLQGIVPGYDQYSNNQRELLKTAQALQQKKLREQLVTSGLRDTGAMLESGVITPNEQQTRERINLESTLAAEKARQANEIRSTGITGASNVLNLLQGGALQQQQLTQQQQQFEKQLTQQALQFGDELSFKKWATQAGLDDAAQSRIWQSVENAKQLGSQEKIAFANLSLGQQQLYQQGKQFDTKLAFDTWAKEQDISEADKQRVWAAIQQDKQLAGQKEIAQMHINNEQWKQSRVEELTLLGWNHEAAMQKALFEQQSVLQQSEQFFQKEIEAGRLTLEDKKLALSAQQFTDQLSFQKWAKTQDISQQEADRIWKTKERIEQNVYLSQQADLDRQIQKFAITNNMTIEQQKLAQQATQFKDELEFKKWAESNGIAMENAKMAWQAGQNAQQKAHEVQMQQMQIAFQEKGMNFDAVMNYIKTLPPEQAAAAMKDYAVKAGITYTESIDGKSLITSALPYSPKNDTSGWLNHAKALGVSETDALELWKIIHTPGAIPESLLLKQFVLTKQGLKPLSAQEVDKQKFGEQISQIMNKINSDKVPSITEYEILKNTGNFSSAFTGVLTTYGQGGIKKFTPEAYGWLSKNVGQIIKTNTGDLYQIIDYFEPEVGQSGSPFVKLKSIVSGRQFDWQGGVITEPKVSEPVKNGTLPKEVKEGPIGPKN